MSPLSQKVKTGADDRLVLAGFRVPSRLVKQIAGDLFDDESIVGQVGVERANHIIAIAPAPGMS